jgi:hypothetical protein
LLASALIGIAFGLAPALKSSRPDLVSALKDAGATEIDRGGFTLRNALVAVQVSVSIVLLVAGAVVVSRRATRSTNAALWSCRRPSPIGCRRDAQRVSTR